ncbi:MAG TPA: hypothetical protein DHV36_13350 [Desulfobacteraceae bacterium]|nr:hypothetical protein [Desulfobacteraceae bacterium]
MELEKSMSQRNRARAIPKVSTGISPLDNILEGGFPRDRTILIKGGSGTGKTLLALEFLCANAAGKTPGIFVSFEETADDIRQNALSVGLDLDALEKEGSFFLWDVDMTDPSMVTGPVSIEALLAGIQGKAKEMGAPCIVFDGLDLLLRFFKTPEQRRNELYRLNSWLKTNGFTAVLNQKQYRAEADKLNSEAIDYMADCLLLLDRRIKDQVITRRLQVAKYRGSGFSTNQHPFAITDRGIRILPLSDIRLTRPSSHKKRISSGSPDLDRILGGGFASNATVLLTGPSGIGKTTFATTFSCHACDRGRRVLYVSFEEAPQVIVENMRSPGIDLSQAVESESLAFYASLPEIMGVESHLFQLMDRIEAFDPHHLVVDAVSALGRMGTRRGGIDFLTRLIFWCKDREITCLLTDQVQENPMISTSAVSALLSVIDTHIALGFYKSGRRFLREIRVVKSRGVHHSSQCKTFSITDKGIRIHRDESRLEGE